MMERLQDFMQRLQDRDTQRGDGRPTARTIALKNILAGDNMQAVRVLRYAGHVHEANELFHIFATQRQAFFGAVETTRERPWWVTAGLFAGMAGAVVYLVRYYEPPPRKKRAKKNKKRASQSRRSDTEVERRFRELVNMSPQEIERWRRDSRSTEASYVRTRSELPLLAKMLRSRSWTEAMHAKARRCINFIERHEAQMTKGACTRTRLIALMNWGRKTPWCDLASFGLT